VSERLRRWSEDETVGRALLAAGAIILVVQLMPPSLLQLAARLWPLAVVAIGVLLIVRNAGSSGAPPTAR
jgi:hypothetical protein